MVIVHIEEVGEATEVEVEVEEAAAMVAGAEVEAVMVVTELGEAADTVAACQQPRTRAILHSTLNSRPDHRTRATFTRRSSRILGSSSRRNSEFPISSPS